MSKRTAIFVAIGIFVLMFIGCIAIASGVSEDLDRIDRAEQQMDRALDLNDRLMDDLERDLNR